jgi:hypothetical protein
MPAASETSSTTDSDAYSPPAAIGRTGSNGSNGSTMPNCEETKAYADWLKDRGTGFTAGIKTAALDPFRGYANAIRDELPEAITVLDAFYSEVLVIPMSAGRGCWRGIPGGADTSA